MPGGNYRMISECVRLQLFSNGSEKRPEELLPGALTTSPSAELRRCYLA